VDSFCILATRTEHVRRCCSLKNLGVDQFAVYLQHDDKEDLAGLRREVIPAIAESVLAKS